MIWFWFIQKDSAGISCKSQNHTFFPYVPLLLSHSTSFIVLTDQIFSKGTKLSFFFSLSSPSPSWRRKYIISGDKHRKQDVLSCCESYFSYPLLPSQVQAASTSPPEQLRQLLNTTRKAASRKPTLHFPPSSLRKTTSSIFFLKQIHIVGLPLTHCWCPYL